MKNCPASHGAGLRPRRSLPAGLPQPKRASHLQTRRAPLSHRPLLTVHCSLFTDYCSLLTIHYSLLTDY